MVETFGHGFEGVSDSHGSARFATKAERASLVTAPSGLLIGRDPDSGALLRYAGPAHLLTMAPTRTGKGVGTIIPNLLTLERSILCIDPKGENAIITAKARDRSVPCISSIPLASPALPPPHSIRSGVSIRNIPMRWKTRMPSRKPSSRTHQARPAKPIGMRKRKPCSPA